MGPFLCGVPCGFLLKAQTRGALEKIKKKKKKKKKKKQKRSPINFEELIGVLSSYSKP